MWSLKNKTAIAGPMCISMDKSLLRLRRSHPRVVSMWSASALRMSTATCVGMLSPSKYTASMLRKKVDEHVVEIAVWKRNDVPHGQFSGLRR
jgi:hypothetical protein